MSKKSSPELKKAALNKKTEKAVNRTKQSHTPLKINTRTFRQMVSLVFGGNSFLYPQDYSLPSRIIGMLRSTGYGGVTMRWGL
ncbi:MAG: hypothetical protein ACR2PW_01355 [Gammaproteobacteria bacterium]